MTLRVVRILRCVTVAFLLSAVAGGIVVVAPASAQASPGDISGTISTDTTWAGGHITGDVTIEAGITVTVPAGSLIALDPYVSITVEGTLESMGTPTSGVDFEQAQFGTGWGQIDAGSGSTLYLVDTAVQGGGDLSSTVTDSSVVCDSCRASIHGGGITGGALTGLRLFDNANVAVDGASIFDNQGDGIHVIGGSLYVWGSVVQAPGTQSAIEVDQGQAVIADTVAEGGDPGPVFGDGPTFTGEAFPSAHVPAIALGTSPIDFGTAGTGRYTLLQSDALGGGVELNQGQLTISQNLLTGPLIWAPATNPSDCAFGGLTNLGNYIYNPGGYATWLSCPTDSVSPSFEADPELVAPGYGDFHLSSGSPALGFGPLGPEGTTFPLPGRTDHPVGITAQPGSSRQPGDAFDPSDAPGG